jgi:hypothetical protein
MEFTVNVRGLDLPAGVVTVTCLLPAAASVAIVNCAVTWEAEDCTFVTVIPAGGSKLIALAPFRLVPEMAMLTVLPGDPFVGLIVLMYTGFVGTRA